MATKSRYVANVPILHNGTRFAVGAPLALTLDEAVSMGSAVTAQAGALPAMPADPLVPAMIPAGSTAVSTFGSAQGVGFPMVSPVLADDMRPAVEGAAGRSLIGTLAMFGDSRAVAAVSFTAGGQLQATAPRQVMVWLNYYLGGPWRWLQQTTFGVGGERTDQWSDGHAAILAAKPDFVYVSFPTNDVSQNIEVAVTVGYLDAYINDHLKNGSRVILATNGPKAYTNAQWVKVKQINAWLAGKARSVGAVLIDCAAPVGDPTTGQYAAGYSYDNVHESSSGAARQASAAKPLFHARARRESRMSRANLWDTAAYNPAMAGSVSGLPSGWNSYGVAGTRTKVARSDIPGEWARAVFTSAADTEQVGISQAMQLLTAWSAGAKALGVRIKGSGGDHWVCSTAGTSSGTEPAAMAAASLPGDTVTDSGGVVWTRVVTIVPGMSRVTVSAEIAVSGTGGFQPRIDCTFGGAAGDLAYFRAMSSIAADALPLITDTSSDPVPVLTTPTVLVPADATALTVYVYSRGSNGTTLTCDIGRVLVEVE